MRSYIKILGPPLGEALRALETLAIDMPQVCIMDKIIIHDIPPGVSLGDIANDLEGTPIMRDIESDPTIAERTQEFFNSRGVEIPIERCNSIISKSGEQLGENDFFFEWTHNVSHEELNLLIEKIDKSFEKLGCLYSIEDFE